VTIICKGMECISCFPNCLTTNLKYMLSVNLNYLIKHWYNTSTVTCILYKICQSFVEWRTQKFCGAYKDACQSFLSLAPTSFLPSFLSSPPVPTVFILRLPVPRSQKDHLLSFLSPKADSAFSNIFFLRRFPSSYHHQVL
jgi:hypothetical protein